MSNKPRELRKWPGKSVEKIRDAYDEEEAESFTERTWLKHLLAGRARRRQFDDADGRVLDVACGVGPNFRYLPESADIVGVDISNDMLEFAREEAADLGRRVSLEQMDAQDLDFDDDTFDNVISSFSTCTFPDPMEALSELGRVCKPNGRVRLLEHGKFDFAPLAWLQERRAESEYHRVGCRLFDDPAEVVRQSELDVVVAREWRFPPFTGIVARPIA